jgi:nucleotidyltransferase/DNA polymerase involved in DNA repair
MTMAQAMALLPDIVMLEPDPDRLARGTQQVLQVLADFSPRIMVDPVGQFHVGMEGMRRHYGSPENQVRHILHAMQKELPPTLLQHIQIGGAPGRLGAAIAAQVARPGQPVLIPDTPPHALVRFLAPQALEVLPVDIGTIIFLQRLGIQTLGELAKIPVIDLIRHLGAQGRMLHAMARGTLQEGVPLLKRPVPIRVHLDFPAPTGDRIALDRALEHLVRRVMTHPERKGRGIHHLKMGGALEAYGSWETEVTLHQPSIRQDRITLALRTRLNLVPPPRAVESLFLDVLAMGSPIHQTNLLQGASAFPDGVRKAVRDLRLRTGKSPILRVVDLDPHSRIPERRYGLLPME